MKLNYNENFKLICNICNNIVLDNFVIMGCYYYGDYYSCSCNTRVYFKNNKVTGFTYITYINSIVYSVIANVVTNKVILGWQGNKKEINVSSVCNLSKEKIDKIIRNYVNL